MNKIIVFLYNYYLKIDESENSAYFRVAMWFFGIFGIFGFTTLVYLFDIELFKFNLFEKGRFWGYLEGFLVPIPFLILFWFLYPKSKIKSMQNKYEYPKHYIWRLRVLFVLYVLLCMLIKIYFIEDT